MSIARPPREQEAIDEIERSYVSIPVAVFILCWFALVTTGPAVAHLVQNPHPLFEISSSLLDSSVKLLRSPSWSSNEAVLHGIDDLESEIRNGSPLAHDLRPVLASRLFSLWGTGNAQVVPAGDTLYFQPSIDYIRGKPFLTPAKTDPVRTIIRFQEDLRRQGIVLVLLPAPVKPTMDGTPLGLTYGAENPSWERFLSRLRQHKLPVIDPKRILRDSKTQSYLNTDTHWTWDSMEQVARYTATELHKMGIERKKPIKRSSNKTIHSHGDLFELLGVQQDLVKKDTVTIQSLTTPLQPSSPDVLLLGDSFSNIYHDRSLHFGENAGFAEQLSHFLQQPVDSIIINDGGAISTRRALASDLSRLDGIKVVLWEFAERELLFGDWGTVPIAGEDALEDGSWVRLAPGEDLQIRARIVEIAPATPPRRAVYPDEIVAVRLQMIKPSEPSEAWAYAWSLTDRAPQRGARLKVGDSVSFTATSFNQAPKSALSASRSELPDRPSNAPTLWVRRWND